MISRRAGAHAEFSGLGQHGLNADAAGHVSESAVTVHDSGGAEVGYNLNIGLRIDSSLVEILQIVGQLTTAVTVEAARVVSQQTLGEIVSVGRPHCRGDQQVPDHFLLMLDGNDDPAWR